MTWYILIAPLFFTIVTYSVLHCALSHNYVYLTFWLLLKIVISFLTVATLYLTMWLFFTNCDFLSHNVTTQMWLYTVSKCEFISHNYDFISHNVNLFFALVAFNASVWHICDFIAHNYFSLTRLFTSQCDHDVTCNCNYISQCDYYLSMILYLTIWLSRNFDFIPYPIMWLIIIATLLTMSYLS